MLREIVQVLVLPNTFRSIDFSRKGVYCLNFQLVDKTSGGNIHGYPFHLKGNEQDRAFQSTVDIQTGIYRTQSFFISFNCQKLDFLPGGCLFRIQAPWQGKNTFELDVRLMHIDTDSIQNPLIKPSDFKQKGRKIIKVQRQRDFYGDLIFGEFDYFCSIELTIHFVKLDYRFRLHSYQLSDFAKSSKKEQIQKQKQLKKSLKLSSVQQQEALLMQIIKNQSLQSFYKKVVIKQIQNYQKLYKKYQSFLQFLNEFQIINFWKRHQMIPKDLQYLNPSQQITNSYLKNKYKYVKRENAMFIEILKESNLIGKNIRYIWMINYELESYLLKKRFGYFREQYQVDIFFDTRRKFFRDPTANRQFEVQRFKSERKQDDSNKYPLIFAPLFDFPERKTGHSLIVMVHGFQGSDYDMDLVKNYLMTYNRNIFCYVCRSLEGNNSDTIQVLGQKFAKQTMNIMARLGGQFNSVSFIGYSLGGMVIRAGLKHLQSIKDRVNILLTLASPHLGVTIQDNVLVKTGIWYMTTFQNYPSMKSLSHMDDYLLRLSQDESLRWIKKFIVLGSKQDNFVPCYSAKIQKTKSSQVDTLMQNIIDRVSNISRIQVWFDSNPKMLDKLIGRKAHIEFLQSKEFCQAFFAVYARIF